MFMENPSIPPRIPGISFIRKVVRVQLKFKSSSLSGVEEKTTCFLLHSITKVNLI